MAAPHHVAASSYAPPPMPVGMPGNVHSHQTMPPNSAMLPSPPMSAYQFRADSGRQYPMGVHGAPTGPDPRGSLSHVTAVGEDMVLLRNIETYIKDIHWVAEKTMVLTERNKSMLDEIHTELNPKSARTLTGMDAKDASARPSRTLDKDHTDRMIREAIFEALQSMSGNESKQHPIPKQVEADFQQLESALAESAKSHQRTLEQHAKIIQVQEESVRTLAREHTDAFDSMLHKIDVISMPLEDGQPMPLPSEESKVIKALRYPAGEKPVNEDAKSNAGGQTPGHAERRLQISQGGASDESSHHCDESFGFTQGGESTTSVASYEPPSQTTLAETLASYQEPDTRSWGERFTSSTPFEIFFALLIVLNTVGMCAEAEYRGWGTGYLLGVEGMTSTTTVVDEVFEWIGMAFNVVFTFEVVVKILGLRLKFVRSGWNLFDFTIVSVAWVDNFADIGFLLNPMLLRLVRLVRLFRLARGLAALQMFDNLHLMVRGIKASVPVLMWVVVLVFPLISCCALFMNYMLQDYMDDESVPIKDRLTCYEYFGTYTKATLSIFECTFANFIPLTRFLVVKVDSKYAMFFMSYKMVVGIAMMRIIYGVFLHVTFACARADDDIVKSQKKQENKTYNRKMKAFFKRFDEGGDGYMTKTQFVHIVSDYEIKTWLSGYLELDIHDPEQLYYLIDITGEDQISYEDLVRGFSRLKGAARSVDILALTRLAQETLNKLDEVMLRSTRPRLPATGLSDSRPMQARTCFV